MTDIKPVETQSQVHSSGSNGGQKGNAKDGALKQWALQRRVSGFGIFFMGVAIFGFALVVVYTLVKLWPALQAGAKTDKDLQAFTSISWFGMDRNLTQEKALLLVVVFSGALGGLLHVATSFGDYVGNRKLMRSWLWFYILRPVVGGCLALLFYFSVRGGLFTTNAGSSDLNPYGMAALAGLVGLFSKQATDKLRELFDTAFTTKGDADRAQSLSNPKPELAGIAPAKMRVGGELSFTLQGKGFIPESQVQVAVLGQPDATRTVHYKDGQTLVVTLDANDLSTPGIVSFRVFNPQPGGGTSDRETIEIMSPDDGNGGNGGDALPAADDPNAKKPDESGDADSGDDTAPPDQSSNPPTETPEN